MEDIFRTIEKEWEEGRPAVLATIVSHKGSTPRATGTRMAIKSDGSGQGTIGGGKVEADVLAAAAEVFREKKNRILFFRLQGEEAAESAMLCGGELEVYLEYYPCDDTAFQAFLKRILDLWRKGERAVLAVPLKGGIPAGPETVGRLFLPGEVETDRELSGFEVASRRVPEVLATGLPLLVQSEDPKGDERIFLDLLGAAERLIIFGAGHVSAALCPLAKRIGFRVTVVDDRAEFAHPTRFPQADELLVSPFPQATKTLSFLPSDFVVIMTRGHLHDFQVLKEVLPRPLTYLGMIGSRRKKEALFRALREEHVPEALLQAVHTPIGLDIGAETPEEIAVSIAAELIRVRAGKRKEAADRAATPGPIR